MSTNPLDQYLSIDSDGTLVLAGDTFPDDLLEDLLVAYNGGEPLRIDNAEKQSTADTITVNGTASFMEMPDLPVTAVFTMGADNKPTATLRFTLIGETPTPNAWRFSLSFPSLPDFPSAKSDVSNAPHFLDTLKISNAAFTLTTRNDAQDSTTGVTVPLYYGLNFVGQVRPLGVIGLFDVLIGGDKLVTLYGSITTPVPTESTPPLPPRTNPWQTRWSVPGIQLQAELGIEFNLSDSKLLFHDTMLRIFCPVTEEWLDENKTYVPTTAVTGKLEIPSASITANLTAKILQNFSGLTLGATFDGITLEKLAQLTDLAGGNDLFDSLPPEIKQYGETLGGLTLEAIGISFVGSLVPNTVYITVGMPKVKFSPMPKFTVSSPYANFMVSTPFSSTRALVVTLGGDMDVWGASFLASVEVPSLTGRASLQEQATIPLSTIFTEVGLKPPADLTVDTMELMIAPGQGFSFNAIMANKPSWELDIGPTPMVVSDLQLALSRDTADGTKGSFGGNIDFNNDLSLAVRYELPGDFYIRAEFPETKLSELMARLNEIPITLPAGFDINFQDTWLLIEKQDSNLTFSVATTAENLGLAAFKAEKMEKWGFAIGVDLDVPNIVAIPGLDVLAPFQSFVGLDKLMLVISSLTDPDFEFPSITKFNAPPLGNRNIKMPKQANGLTQGMNIYGQLNTTTSQPFQALAKYLGIALDGSVGVAIAVSLPNPITDSKLYISVSQEVQKGTTITGMLGAGLRGGQVVVFLTAVLKTQVQGQPMQFDTSVLALQNGVLITGTMKGSPIRFNPLPVQLSNLGLVIGLSFEGIPTFGIAATLDVSNFNSSVAIFFDSTNPSQSMFAGSVSNLTLLDVTKTLAGQASVPAEVNDVLGQIGLKGLSAFHMPASVATALDNRDLPAIASAFMQYGNTKISSTSSNVSLEINTAGSVWHLTDLSSMTMPHYSLTLQGNQIAVELQAQIYCAPQDTWIGSLKFMQGFRVEAEIDFMILKVQASILITVNSGIEADVAIAPIIIYNSNFFSVTDAGGQGGPLLSLATFVQPTKKDPIMRPPHFFITGKLRILGLDAAIVYIAVTTKGLEFKLTLQITPALYLDLQGSFTSLNNLSVSGAANVGLDRQLDLGPRGQVRVQMVVQGSLKLGYDGRNAYATYQGSFDFYGVHGDIPPTTLNVNGPALANIADTVWGPVSDIISKALLVADQWLKWVGNNVIPGVKDNAELVGRVLKQNFGLQPNDITSKTQQFLGYGASAVASALKGAGVPPEQVIQILQGIGVKAEEIAKIISGVFSNQKVNITLGHVDTPAGPHIDTPVPPHGDTYGPHVDVPSTHADGKKFGVHGDIGSPRVNRRPHIDTPAGPHTDGPKPPHIDTGTHIDIK